MGFKGYRQAILDIAPGYDPRHVEAYMRLTFGTLDHLSPEEFRREVYLACRDIDEGGVDQAEGLARSYGM